jgi:hypothetical protein
MGEGRSGRWAIPALRVHIHGVIPAEAGIPVRVAIGYASTAVANNGDSRFRGNDVVGVNGRGDWTNPPTTLRVVPPPTAWEGWLTAGLVS